MTRIVIHGVGGVRSQPLARPATSGALPRTVCAAPPHRGNGWGKVLKAAQNKYLQDHMFDYAICTVRRDNEAQKHILKQAGWEYQDMFFDRRQDCYVEVWGYCVPQGE